MGTIVDCMTIVGAIINRPRYSGRVIASVLHLRYGLHYIVGLLREVNNLPYTMVTIVDCMTIVGAIMPDAFLVG